MAFNAGDDLTAQLLNDTFPDTKFNRANTVGSATNTSYTATLTGGGVAAGTSFTAPLSGKVTIHFATAGFNSGANDNKTAVRVGTGATPGGGSTIYAATDDDMILFTGAATYGIAGFTEVSGLTPGTVYNAQMQHRVSGGTGSWLFKRIKVVPN